MTRENHYMHAYLRKSLYRTKWPGLGQYVLNVLNSNNGASLHHKLLNTHTIKGPVTIDTYFGMAKCLCTYEYL